MDLYKVDLSTLTTDEQIKLQQFRQAYRPHTAPPSRATLRAEGNGGYFTEHNTIQEIKQQAKFMDTWYYTFLETAPRDSKGNITDNPE